jgi:hypothetical protein
MAVIFLEGWDKYGPINGSSSSIGGLLMGEWTSWTGSIATRPPLSATGLSMAIPSNSSITKALGANYIRLIGGVRFNPSLVTGHSGIQFQDGGSNQAGIRIATSTGIISVVNGAMATGTILASSLSGVPANTTHYLEWDITFGNSASYQVWLDGVSIISGTGDTTTTANNSANVFQFVSAVGPTNTIDDFYLFDSTGTVNNAPLLTSPRIETTLPTSDSAVQFSIGAAVLGQTVSRTTNVFTFSGNNGFYVRAFTPSKACTINSLTMITAATSATVQLRPVVYTDNAGLPGTLMTSGSTVVGQTNFTPLVMPLTTPQTLAVGTQYWLGFMSDIRVSNQAEVVDGGNAGRSATSVTFSSGAPGTAPTTTAGDFTVLLWGNITLSSPVNDYSVNQQPPPAADQSYVFDGTVSAEDLYSFANLSGIPARIYTVAVKAYCARSDTGARTVSLRMKSSATDVGGSLTGQTPGVSYAWIGSNFETDPNGGIPWSGVTLNAAQSGFKIDA